MISLLRNLVLLSASLLFFSLSVFGNYDVRIEGFFGFENQINIGDQVSFSCEIKNYGTFTGDAVHVIIFLNGNQFSQRVEDYPTPGNTITFPVSGYTASANPALFSVEIRLAVGGLVSSAPTDQSEIDLSVGKGKLTILVRADQYANETTWYLIEGNTLDTIASGGPYPQEDEPGTYVVELAQLYIDDNCYLLSVDDSFGDGMCCEYGEGQIRAYDIHLNASGGNTFSFLAETPLNNFGENYIQIFCVTTGCTDQNACNYNPDANLNDGTCTTNCGCGDIEATNYNPNVEYNIDGACIYSCPTETPFEVKLSIQTDCYPVHFFGGVSEEGAGGATFLNIQPQTLDIPFHTYNIPLCFSEPDCYTVEITDSFEQSGNTPSSQCALINGKVSLTNHFGVSIFDLSGPNDGEFRFEETFCISEECGDPLAINYVPNGYGHSNCLYENSPSVLCPSDVDQNGTIGILDFLLVAGNLGEDCGE